MYAVVGMPHLLAWGVGMAQCAKEFDQQFTIDQILVFLVTHIWTNYCIPLCPIFGANYTLQGHTMDNYSSVASWLILLLLIIIIGFIIIQVSHASWKIANSFSRSWKNTWILQNQEKSWKKYCQGPLKWTK